MNNSNYIKDATLNSRHGSVINHNKNIVKDTISKNKYINDVNKDF
jgi:hypothetical protein